MEIILLLVVPLLGFFVIGLAFLCFYIFTKSKLCILIQLRQIYNIYKTKGFYEFTYKKSPKRDLFILFLCLLPLLVILISIRAYLNTYIAVICIITIVLIIFSTHVFEKTGVKSIKIKNNTLILSYYNNSKEYIFDSIEKIAFNMRYYPRRTPIFLYIKPYNSDKYDSHLLLYSNTPRAVAEIVFLELMRKNSLVSIDFMSEDDAQQILSNIKSDTISNCNYFR